MRPRSDDRQRLLAAAATLAGGELGGGTFLQLASLAGVEPSRARVVSRNMRTAGELVKVRDVVAPHSRRPLACLAPAGMAPQQRSQENLLNDVMRRWHVVSW